MKAGRGLSFHNNTIVQNTVLYSNSKPIFLGKDAGGPWWETPQLWEALVPFHNSFINILFYKPVSPQTAQLEKHFLTFTFHLRDLIWDPLR